VSVIISPRADFSWGRRFDVTSADGSAREPRAGWPCVDDRATTSNPIASFPRDPARAEIGSPEPDARSLID